MRYGVHESYELDVDSPAGVGLPKHSHLPNLGNPLRESADNTPRLVNEHNLLLPHVRNTYIISESVFKVYI